MSEEDTPTELPEFVTEAFLEGYDSQFIDRVEFTSQDPVWRGQPAAPKQRKATLHLAIDAEGAVVCEKIMDHPNDQRLLFSDVDAAIEWYEDKVEEVAQAESEMVSAAGRVTFERDKADGIDTDPEFEIPDDVINLADVDSDQSHCNRCREPVPETNEKTIGDIVFCPDCHDVVCGRCGQEIPDPENRYVTDGVGSGTTCPSCTADHVDWLCSECHTEIRDEAARVEITDGQLSGTYCQDCGSDVRERIDREDRTQNKDAPF